MIAEKKQKLLLLQTTFGHLLTAWKPRLVMQQYGEIITTSITTIKLNNNWHTAVIPLWAAYQSGQCYECWAYQCPCQRQWWLAIQFPLFLPVNRPLGSQSQTQS